MSPHLLLIDLSNLAFVCGFRFEKQAEQADVIDRLFANLKEYIRQLIQQFQSKSIILACDSSDHYWRTKIYPSYKAHREETQLKLLVRQVLVRFKQEHAKQCLEIQGCEADDVIYVVATSTPGLVTIVSTDRDFIQLISHRVKLYNPVSCEYRYPEEDKSYVLFEKCFRGDRSDNIPSACPKVSRKILKAAYKDDKKLDFLLSSDHPEGGKVREKYEMNCQLIDLHRIPREHQLKVREALILSN